MENGLGQVHQKVPALLGVGGGFSVKAVAMTVFIWKTKYNTQPLIKEKPGERLAMHQMRQLSESTRENFKKQSIWK